MLFFYLQDVPPLIVAALLILAYQNLKGDPALLPYMSGKQAWILMFATTFYALMCPFVRLTMASTNYRLYLGMMYIKLFSIWSCLMLVIYALTKMADV